MRMDDRHINQLLDYLQACTDKLRHNSVVLLLCIYLFVYHNNNGNDNNSKDSMVVVHNT